MLSEMTMINAVGSMTNSINRLAELIVTDMNPAMVFPILTEEYFELLKTVTYILENEAPSEKIRQESSNFSMNIDLIKMELQDNLAQFETFKQAEEGNL